MNENNNINTKLSDVLNEKKKREFDKALVSLWNNFESAAAGVTQLYKATVEDSADNSSLRDTLLLVNKFYTGSLTAMKQLVDEGHKLGTDRRHLELRQWHCRLAPTQLFVRESELLDVLADIRRHHSKSPPSYIIGNTDSLHLRSFKRRHSGHQKCMRRRKCSQDLEPTSHRSKMSPRKKLYNDTICRKSSPAHPIIFDDAVHLLNLYGSLSKFALDRQSNINRSVSNSKNPFTQISRSRIFNSEDRNTSPKATYKRSLDDIQNLDLWSISPKRRRQSHN